MRFRRLGVPFARWACGALIFVAVAASTVATASEGSDAPSLPLAPDGGDTVAVAQQPQPYFNYAIDRPGDHDWYYMRGASDIEFTVGPTVTITLVQAGSCTAVRPLLIGLHNPEGRWIRTYVLSTEGNSDRGLAPSISVQLPPLPSRYYLHVRAADSSCFGLQYFFPEEAPTAPSEEPVSHALLCRLAHNDRVRAATRLRKLKRARHSVEGRAARQRYTRYVKLQRGVLKRTHAYERRTCAKGA